MNERPRFSSAVRSVFSVATCTGLPESLPSQLFNSSGEVETNWPSRWKGIPSAAHRLITDRGSPKNSEICFQPFRVWDCAGLFDFSTCFRGFGIVTSFNRNQRHSTTVPTSPKRAFIAVLKVGFTLNDDPIVERKVGGLP